MAFLPDASLTEAAGRAAELNAGVRSLTLDSAPVRVLTFSLGLAALPEHGDTAAEVLSAADDALYRAMRQGRAALSSPTPRNKSILKAGRPSAALLDRDLGPGPEALADRISMINVF